MNNPNWRTSRLYQGIISGYSRRGAELTPAQRRRLRENLKIAEAARPDRAKPFWCEPLVVAFTWQDSPQGAGYWAYISARLMPFPKN